MKPTKIRTYLGWRQDQARCKGKQRKEAANNGVSHDSLVHVSVPL